MDPLTGVASDNVRSTPQSRPFLGQALRSANDPKRTFSGLRGSEGRYGQDVFTVSPYGTLFAGAHTAVNGDIGVYALTRLHVWSTLSS